MTALVQYSTLDNTIVALAKECLLQEQVEIIVNHKFLCGMYIREARMPKGTLVIGHVHRKEHLNIMLSGKLLMLQEDGSEEIFEAPMMYVAPAGRKVAVMLEDVVWQNVYVTNLTEIDEIEEQIFDAGEFKLPHQVLLEKKEAQKWLE